MALIGIDIGTRFVKVVNIEYKGKYYLKNAFLFPAVYQGSHPPGKINEKDFFKQIISKIPLPEFKTSLIAVNIPSSLVQVMTVDLPKMSKKELNIAAIAEAKRKLVPPPGPKSIFEYSILGEIIISKIPRYKVLVIKTEKDYIEQLINIFNKFAGIIPAFISSSSYTIAHAFSRDSTKGQAATAFIDIGHDSIDIDIAKEGNLYFYRDVKFGLKNIIAHLSMKLDLSADETERVLQDKGVPEVDFDLSDRVKVAEEIMRQKYELSLAGKTQTEINPLELRLAWEANIERIVHEIRRSLVYYKEQSAGGRVENIFFVGGGAKIQGLVPALTKNFGGDCRIFDPFQERGISFKGENFPDLEQQNTFFAVALSMALSIPLTKKDRSNVVNFLPVEFKQRESIAQKRSILMFVSILLISFSILGWTKFLRDNKLLKLAVNRIEKEMEEVKDTVTALERLKRQKKNIDEKSVKVREIIRRRAISAEVLMAIAQSTPEKILLIDIMISSPAVFLPEQGTGLEQEQTLTDGPADLTKDTAPGSSGQFYKVKIEASCFADYEKMVVLAQEYKEKLETNRYFQNTRLNLPELEKVLPMVENTRDIILTETRLRIFSMEVDLMSGENEKF